MFCLSGLEVLFVVSYRIVADMPYRQSHQAAF
jgi:hypothetical protein